MVVRGIVLKSVHFSDTQKIIRVFSQEKGYLSLITPSSLFKRKSHPLHLLQVCEIEYLENEKGDLHKLRSASPIHPLSQLYFDIVKMNIALLWGEVLDLLLRNEGRNEALFDYVERSIEYLNDTQRDTANFNLVFFYRLAGLIGYRIDTDSWQEGHVFDLNGGRFCVADGRTPCVSGPYAAGLIYRLCTCPVEEIREIRLNREARTILLDTILLFYSIHLNVDFNVKSIRVIREVFA